MGSGPAPSPAQPQPWPWPNPAGPGSAPAVFAPGRHAGCVGTEERQRTLAWPGLAAETETIITLIWP
jgi:hypothetical protein